MTKPLKSLDYCFVGSTNPVKLDAVRQAVLPTWSKAKIIGYEVKSGVDNQPRSDKETKLGAVNRAQRVLALGLSENKIESNAICLGFGLQGGVCQFEGKLWSTVWAAVATQDQRIFTANGARISLPPSIAKPIQAGAEMGPVLSQLFAGADIRHNQGMIGVVTRNLVTRTDEYANLAKLALGLWYGLGWEETTTK